MMRLLAALLLAPLLAAACATEPISGGLMLTMSTDLVVPTGVDVVGIYIVRVEDGRSTLLSSNEVTAEYTEDGIPRVRLPGTLSIASDGNPQTTIQIRIVAYDFERVPVAMREARVVVPLEDVKSLPMPLLWLNTEDVVDDDPAAGGPTPITASAGLGLLAEPTIGQASVDAFRRFRSDFCGEGRTLDDTGACVGIDLDSSKLDTWEEREFATGVTDARERNAPADSLGGDASVSHDFCRGTGEAPPPCFNLAGCFPGNDPDPRFRTLEVSGDQIQGLGTPECWIALDGVAGIRNGLAALRAAVAVKTTREQGALCTAAGDCYVAVDDKFGAEVDRANRRIVLPPGVCRKAAKGSVLAIVASPLCDRKLADEPVCVDAAGVAVDAGCRDGSGWNGDLDDVRPVPDGGPDGGDSCTGLAGATGFWVEGADLVVASGAGELTVFDSGQLDGACLTGAPRGPNVRIPQAPAIPYRVFGGAGLFAFAGVGALPGAAATGLFILEPGGAVPVGRTEVVGIGPAAAGAFFPELSIQGAIGPGAAFVSLSSELRLARPGASTTAPVSSLELTASGSLFGVPTAFDNVIWQLARNTRNELELRHFDLSKTTGAASFGLIEQSDSPLAGYEPLALTRSERSGAVMALAANENETAIFDVQLEASFDGLFKRGVVTGPAAPEMTLALAVANDGTTTYPYFGVGDTLYRFDGSQDVEVEQAPGGTVHAVQVVGSNLYWLQTDAQRRTTLRHVVLENGLPPR